MAIVKLSRIVDGLEGAMVEDWSFYLDKETGETFELDDGLASLLESIEDSLKEEGMTIESACALILEDPTHYSFCDFMSDEEAIDYVIGLLGHELIEIEALPSYEQYELMEDFIETLSDEHEKQLLYVAIDGKGAFRRFKDVAFSIDKLQHYYHYKDKAVFEAAREWCKDHDIEFEDDWEQVEKTRYLDKGLTPV